jgi:hypothetical protein
MATNSNSKNSSSKTQQSEISFATSSKRKPLLIYETYLFKCNKTTASEKYWLSTERKCSVYVHKSVLDEFISISDVHNHSAIHTK